MKKAWFIAIVLLAGIALGLLSCKREPSYNGKSFTYWFTQFCTSGHSGRYEAADREEATYALRKMGTNIYPLLLKEYFSKEKGTVMDKVSYQLRRLVSRNRDFPPYIKPEEIHEEAARVFGKIGVSTLDLLPLLSEALGPNTNQYHGAIFLLGCVRENREQAIPYLVKALKQPRAWSRGMALQSLSWLGEAADSALPDLLEMFEKTNQPEVPLITLIGNVGPRAKAAVPKLEKICASTNQSRFAAAVALYQIDPTNTTAQTLLNNLADGRAREFEDTVMVFGGVRKIPAQIIQRLIKTARGNSHSLQISILEKKSPQAAIEILHNMLEADAQTTQLWAAGCLLRIDWNHPQARDLIFAQLKNPNREKRWDEYAIQQLSEASPESKEVLDLLDSIAKTNPEEGLRKAAEKALKRIRIRRLMREEGWKDYAPYQ